MLISILVAIVSVFLVAAILLQTQGTGLSATFGGGEFYRSKRSVEKLLIWVTIILATLFAVLSIGLLLYR